jgi:hypothetical protein
VLRSERPNWNCHWALSFTPLMKRKRDLVVTRCLSLFLKLVEQYTTSRAALPLGAVVPQVGHVGICFFIHLFARASERRFLNLEGTEFESRSYVTFTY